MPEKFSSSVWVLGSNPMIHWWFRILPLAFFLGILVVWSIDGWNFRNFHKDFVIIKLYTTHENMKKDSHEMVFSSNHCPVQLNSTFRGKPHQNLSQIHSNLTLTRGNLATEAAPQQQKELNSTISIPQISVNFTAHDQSSTLPPRKLYWVSAELEANYASNLLAKWLTPGGEPCKDSKTAEISVPGLDGRDPIELSTGEIHEFVFQALDESGKPRCLGGDYFETDLSGESWKSRPPVKDLGNGTYTFSLQVHPDFPGNYAVTVILLFGHYEGLKFSAERFAVDKLLRKFTIKFRNSQARLPEIKPCQKSDFTRYIWSGRWTRHAKNESCPISNDGRYRCQEPNFPCEQSWCEGSLGLLESNGWIYSTHCSFKLFSAEEAWARLNNRWIFWWGDSNHCDTIRNILNFILNVPDIKTIPRRFDMNIANPNNPTQMVRITNVFNGHPNDTGNYQGLNSLANEPYRDMLKGYFSGEAVPDAVIMNSGLHDGIFWPNIRRFIGGAEYAAAFWAEVMEGLLRRGVKMPEVIYRTTVATGGYARRLSYNPQKMEAFNGVVLDKLRKYGVVTRMIDDFDMTYPWHYDNRCNDGVHYGRAPLKMWWRDGEMGHQYFVDLMLGHVLLNALCAR